MTLGRALEAVTRNERETVLAGRALGALVSPGDVVLLFGDLGSGKTVFVRGLAEGLGADPGEVASPTFSLVNEYGPGARPILAHADLYRLSDRETRAGLADLGLEDLRLRGAVVAIEWPRPPYAELDGWRVTIREGPGGIRSIRLAGR